MRLSVIAASLLGVLPLACGGSDSQPQDQYSAQGQYGQGQYGQQPGGYGQQCPPGQYCPQQQPPPAATGTQPPATTPPPAGTAPAAGGGSAQPIAPAMAAGATPILTAMAQAEVQGMQPDGGAFAGQFQEGQTLEQPFQIQPGKCYAVIGAGIGVQELDIQIVAHQPPLPPATLAQDQTQGPQATLGGRGNCFKNPLPVGGPAKVVLKATRGAGLAVAQIYVK